MEKSILKNSLFNVLNKGLSLLYPMLTSVYISRVFQAAGVGEVSFAINIITYFTIAASLGIPNYAVKVLAPVRDDEEQLNKVFSELAVIIAMSSILVSFLYYAFIIKIYYFSPEKLKMSAILGLMLIFNILNYDWLYEALEEYRYLAIRSLSVKLLALFLLFLFVKNSDDLPIYCLVYSFVFVANNILNGINCKKYVSVCFRNLNLQKHMKPVFILFAAAVATELYTLLDSTMLGIKCEPQYLGYYTNASRVTRATYGVVFSVIAVYNPRLSYLYKKNKDEYIDFFQKYYEKAIFLALPASIGLLLMAPGVVRILFGSGYEPANLTLQILSILILVFTFATVFGHIPLVIYGKEKVILFSTIVGAATNFGLNYVFIPEFQHNGAALASILSEIFVTIILMIGSLRVAKIHLINKNVVATILGSAIMAIYLYMLNFFSLNTFALLVLGITGGSVVFFVSSFFMGNDILKIVLIKIRNQRSQFET